jgi:hypothetical protein
MDDTTLTLFQEDCERAVAAELSLHDSRLVDRTVDGEDEIYVRARIDGADLELFIFEDEASIQGPGTDLSFEAPDYLDPADLIGEVVNSIRYLASQGVIGRV